MKTISFLSIVLFLSLAISCTKEAEISTTAEATTPSAQSLQKASTPSKINVNNNYGYHSFDISNLEQGNYDLTQGTITANGAVHPASISLSNRYLANLCVEQDAPNLFSVGGINLNSDVASLGITQTGSNEVEVEYQLNGNTTILQITGAASTAALLSMTDFGDCTATNGNQRWIPFAIALVAAIATTACGIANSNAASACAGVAADCSNGVAVYEFEGGTCGNGDCDVTCND